VALEPPPPAPGTPESGRSANATAPALQPLDLGPVLYLVERSGSADGTITPVAVLRDGAYASLPDPAETPDLVQRFPLDRWEEGTEFVLFSENVAVGTLISDGSTELHDQLCLPRPRSSGVVHLRPDAAHVSRFLAFRKDDLEALPALQDPYQAHSVTDELRSTSVNVAQNLIAQIGVPWPPSVTGIQRRVDAWVDGEGARSLAASFVFGDDLVVGSPEAQGYSLFVVGTERDEGFRPRFSWYQRADAGEKAFPGFLAAHDVADSGESHVLLEVFGEETRWLAVLGFSSDDAELLYQDACGVDPVPDAFRNHT